MITGTLINYINKYSGNGRNLPSNIEKYVSKKKTTKNKVIDARKIISSFSGDTSANSMAIYFGAGTENVSKYNEIQEEIVGLKKEKEESLKKLEHEVVMHEIAPISNEKGNPTIVRSFYYESRRHGEKIENTPTEFIDKKTYQGLKNEIIDEYDSKILDLFKEIKEIEEGLNYSIIDKIKELHKKVNFGKDYRYAINKEDYKTMSSLYREFSKILNEKIL